MIVEDEPAVARGVQVALEREGYAVSVQPTGEDAIANFADTAPDLVVLDVRLPGIDGFEVLRQLRRETRAPVLFLTARADEVDKVVGLEMGADDYLPKPFSPRELLARIKSVLRRARTLPDNLQPEAARRIGFAGWTLDIATRNLLSPAGVVVALSGTEFKLLRIFLAHPNRVLNRDQLIDLMLSRDASPFDRSIDVQVSRLRHRLDEDAKEPAIIKTVRGEGYVFAAAVEVST